MLRGVCVLFFVVSITGAVRAANVGFNSSGTDGTLNLTVGASVVGAGAAAAPSDIYARGTPGPASGGADYKIIMPSTLGNGFGATVTDGATLNYSFSARLSGFTGYFTQFMAFQRVGIGKINFAAPWAYPNDGLWHTYSTTFTIDDSGIADGTANVWDITDFFIAQNYADADNTFVFEIDDVRLTDASTSQQILLAQTSVGGPVYQNANFDNGDPTGAATLWQPINGANKNHSAAFLVVPEPAAGLSVVLIGFLVASHRKLRR